MDNPTLELPHDLATERAMIGAIMLDGLNALRDIEAVATPNDCYHPMHAMLFETAQRVALTLEPIDAVTVWAALDSKGKTLIGSATNIAKLADCAALASHAQSYAKAVANLARKRRILLAGQAIVAAGSEPDVTADELADIAARGVQTASECRDAGGLISFGDSIDASMIEIEETAKNQCAPDVRKFGFRELDTLTTGMHPSEYVIVAARPAMGKTSFAMDVAVNVAKTGETVYVISKEMSHTQLTKRFLAGHGRVNQSHVRSGLITQEDLNAMVRVASKHFNIPLFFDKALDATLASISSKARRLKREKKLALIVLDYLQLMKGNGEENRNQELGTISRGLKSLALELEIPIIALSQLNRTAAGGKDKRPQLHELRDCGELEQDADIVLMLHREEVYDRNTDDKGVCEIGIQKQRNGPFPEIVKLRFVREHTRFEDMPAESGYGHGNSGMHEDYDGSI